MEIEASDSPNASVPGDGEDKFHLFGVQNPLHSALPGGKTADVILWRNKQISAAVLAGSTVIWLLFERIGYHLIPFICHFQILTIATLFVWSNLSSFINKSPVNFPEITLPEEFCNSVALVLIQRCNEAVVTFRYLVSGKDLKKLAYAIVGLWVVSFVGSWLDFLTMLYINNALYEKNEDRIDSYAKKVKSELKRRCSSLDEKVLQKLPRLPSWKQREH